MNEMHPRILERRWTIAEAGLSYLSPEEWAEEVENWVSRWESRLPLPGNYRKKTLPRLRRVLAEIDQHLEILAGPGWGDVGEAAAAMYRRHRGYVVKELARRARI